MGWGGFFYGLRQCYLCQLVEGRVKEGRGGVNVRAGFVRVLCVGMSAPLEGFCFFFPPCKRRRGEEERRGEEGRRGGLDDYTI